MAQRTTVTVLCDMHTEKEGEVEAAETLAFAFDGTAYEIDVCATHSKDLRERFGGFIEHARRGSMTRSPSSARRPHRSAAGRDHSAEIRRWAAAHGHKVSERGRIPATVVAEYEAAH